MHELSDSKRLLTVNLEAPRVPVVPAMYARSEVVPAMIQWSKMNFRDKDSRTGCTWTWELGWDRNIPIWQKRTLECHDDHGIPFPLSPYIPIISPLATYFISVHPIYLYGYGSIPIDTIFRGMNIHKSQLF